MFRTLYLLIIIVINNKLINIIYGYILISQIPSKINIGLWSPIMRECNNLKLEKYIEILKHYPPNTYVGI